MPEFLPYLLVPVAALLFLNLRLSRRLRYPHDLLQAELRRGAASFLLRSFRTYYDVLLDGAMAVVLAFALAPPQRVRRAAVVIDGTRSMVAGFAAGRPLDKALARLRTDPGLRKAEPFLLAFEPASGKTRLAPIGSLLEDVDAEGAARRLREAFTFFAPDYATLADLRQRGYGEITLLTDQLRVKPEGFRTLELGMAVQFAAFPAGVRYDRVSETWIVVLVETGPYVPLGVSVWDRAGQRFTRMPSGSYVLEEGTAGRVLRFPASGLYLLSLRGPYGQDDIDLPLLLVPDRVTAEAAGSFSERMLSVFPNVDKGGVPTVVLTDKGAKASGPRFTTALVPGDGELLMDPAAAGGALIAVGTSPGADLTLGPSSLGNEDLVLIYAAILAQKPAPFLTRAPRGPLRPVGTAFLTEQGTPLLPPPSQFFETRSAPRLVLPAPSSWRWPWIALLGSLAALKLVVWSRLSGKSLVARS
jgi:hypothetical protein